MPKRKTPDADKTGAETSKKSPQELILEIERLKMKLLTESSDFPGELEEIFGVESWENLPEALRDEDNLVTLLMSTEEIQLALDNANADLFETIMLYAATCTTENAQYFLGEVDDIEEAVGKKLARKISLIANAVA